MDDEGTHPENGFEKCATSSTQKKIFRFCAISIKREQKYSSILQSSLKVISNSLIP